MGFFATFCDSVLWLGERGGMRDRRQCLLAHAQGRTLEIGAGTGLNLSLDPDHVDDLRRSRAATHDGGGPRASR